MAMMAMTVLDDDDDYSEDDNHIIANDVATIPHHRSGRHQEYCASRYVPLSWKNVRILSLSQCHWNGR